MHGISHTGRCIHLYYGIVLLLLSLLLAPSRAVAEEVQLVNPGSMPVPVVRLRLPEGVEAKGFRLSGGKTVPSQALGGEVLLAAPLEGYGTLRLETTDAPGPKAADWLKKLEHGYGDANGAYLWKLLTGRAILMDAFVIETMETPEETARGPVLWQTGVPGAKEGAVRFFGPDAGEVTSGKKPLALETTGPVTIMLRSWFSVPRYADRNKKDVLAPGTGWAYIGPRKGTEPNGEGLYLWCAKGKIGFAKTGVTLAPGTTLRFQRGAFSVNAYAPAEPLVLRPAEGKAGVFAGGNGEYALTALDRNGNDTIDADADLWWVRPVVKGKPTGTGALYAFQPGKDGKGEYLSVAPAPKTYEPMTNTGMKAFVFADPASRDWTRIDRKEAVLVVGEADAKTPPLEGAWTLWDWSASGRLFAGHLFRGGHVPEGAIFEANRPALFLFDLDGDGEADMRHSYDPQFISKGLAAGHQVFDFTDRNGAGLWRIAVNPAAGRVGRENTPNQYPGGPRHAMTARCSFRRTLSTGREYEGAPIGFETFAYYRIDQENLGGGTIIRSEGADLLVKTTGGNIDRLSMGAFGAPRALDWFIELDPLEARDDQPPVYRICTFTDPYGHTVRSCDPVYPQQWDGKALPMRKQKNGQADFFPNTPWYEVTTGTYYELDGVHAVFAPDGGRNHCDEGMYGGQLTFHERIERNVDGVDFHLYYSPLLGGLHLRGADIGYYASPYSWHRGDRHEDRTRYRWDGLEAIDSFIGVEYPLHTPEGKRYWGPTWLYYQDLDGDGYFDAYLYDAENDGVYDSVAWYAPDSGSVLLMEDGRFTSWPEKVDFTVVDYQIGNYDRVEELYLRGLSQDPLPVRVRMTSSGLPVEYGRLPNGVYGEMPKDVFLALDRAWSPRAAVDIYHGDPVKGTWTDYGLDGLVRLGTLLTQKRVLQSTLDAPWSEAALAEVELLLLTRLRRLPDEAELAALFRWVENGGVLLLMPPPNEESRTWFSYLGKRMAFAFGERIENTTSIFRYPSLGAFSGGYVSRETRPAPGNRVERYSAANDALLEGLDYIGFTGHPVEPRGAMRPVLSYGDDVLVAAAELGEGRIVVTGTDLLVNRYIVHPDKLEPDLDNDTLASRLLDDLVASLSRPEVTWSAGHPRPKRVYRKAPAKEWACRVRGKGGRVAFRRIREAHVVTLDGEPVRPRGRGLLEEIEVPAGAHELSLRLEKETAAKK